MFCVIARSPALSPWSSGVAVRSSRSRTLRPVFVASRAVFVVSDPLVVRSQAARPPTATAMPNAIAAARRSVSLLFMVELLPGLGALDRVSNVHADFETPAGLLGWRRATSARAKFVQTPD